MAAGTVLSITFGCFVFTFLYAATQLFPVTEKQPHRYRFRTILQWPCLIIQNHGKTLMRSRTESFLPSISSSQRRCYSQNHLCAAQPGVHTRRYERKSFPGFVHSECNYFRSSSNHFTFTHIHTCLMSSSLSIRWASDQLLFPFTHQLLPIILCYFHIIT